MAEPLFDADFIAALESVATEAESFQSPASAAGAHDELLAFLAPVEPGGPPLDEDAFVALPGTALGARTDALLEAARRSPDQSAAEAVDSFVVFFQTLLPGLTKEGAEQVRRLFFRLVPTLLHLSHAGFAGKLAEGREALSLLETILIEVSSVRLSPTESALVARSLDPLAGLVAAGEFALAGQIVSSQLLKVLERNRVSRNLFLLMQAETALQLQILNALGHRGPRIRIPDDFPALAGYGPIRIIDEADPAGEQRFVVQVQLPDLPMPRHVVLHLAPIEGGATHDLRLDLLGCAELDVPPGTYDLGLLYRPFSNEPTETS